MNRWFIALLVALGVVGTLAIMIEQDDSPPVTVEQIEAAEAEWNSFDEVTRNLICNIWVDHKLNGDDEETILEAMSDNVAESDSGEAKAKIEVMERECDELL